MKHYLLFIIAFCAFGALKAQNPPCDVHIWPIDYENGITTLTAFDSSSAPASSFIWSTGATTSSIEVSTDGVYCVTVTYTDGCTASDCDTLETNYCSAYVSYWTNWNGNIVLTAYKWPNYLDAEYQWSDGQTGQQIIVTQGGTYTVTVTFENGCSSTATVNVPIQQNCEVYAFKVDSGATNSVWLYANMYQAVSYQWSTGESSSYIEVAQTGTYCVTATDGAGCSASYCLTVSCGVDIEQNAAGQYTAHPVLSTPPYSYLWSNGATTQTITPGNTGYYCVTVTDANGCIADSTDCVYHYSTCIGDIEYNSNNTLTANGSGAGPFVYHWTPGDYTTQTITPTEEGVYCVEITDANGCQSYDCRYWYSNDCQVNIHVGLDSSDYFWLYATAGGNAFEWEYLWNTGNTQHTFTATNAGEYCVTVTNIYSGCTASHCVWVQPDNACYASVSGLSIDPYTWELSVAGGPDPIISYAWNTGATTPTIQVTESGYYDVIVTNTAGCTVSSGFQLNESQGLYVYVQLADSTTMMPNDSMIAEVFLIQYDPMQGGILTAIDTAVTYITTFAGTYAFFPNASPGQYLIKAALLPASTHYADYLPTYHESALLWSDADPVTVGTLTNQPGWQTEYVSLISGQNPGGPGFIGGLVSQGANLTGSGDEPESDGEGDPFPGASVVLTLLDGTPVAATTTDANGGYSFGNIAWGTYILTLDIPGLAPVSIIVTIGPNQPSVGNLNFKVDENSIALPTQEIDIENLVKVYPNPAHDFVTVALPESAELTLANGQGQTVLRMVENSLQAKIPVRHLPAGLYFLTARMTSGSQVLKVMVE